MRMSEKAHPHRDATKETTSWHIWHAAVYEMCDAPVEEVQLYATRERISRAYSMGEAVWMAADTAQRFVDGGRLAKRGDDEVAGLRHAIHAGIVAGRRLK